MKNSKNLILVPTHLHARDYTPDEVCRIVNEVQYKRYVKNGAYPIDMYAGYDQDGKDIIVYIFLKEETQELYRQWLAHELK